MSAAGAFVSRPLARGFAVVGVVLALAGLPGAAHALDVNAATADELQQIRGVGPVIAERIVRERRKARFKDLADLKSRVPGVGEAVARNIDRGTTKKSSAGGSSARGGPRAQGRVIEVGRGPPGGGSRSGGRHGGKPAD